MNIFNLLGSTGAQSLDLQEEITNAGRRNAFRYLGDFGKKLMVGGLSIGAVSAAATQKAEAAHEKIVDVLNFALLLEYLESEFYRKGLDSGVIPATGFQQKIFMQIGKHEDQHVEFLKTAISSLKSTPIEKPKFDFTAKGKFDPFKNYGQFLALSQAFEDTGVRAYKGQAANLIENDAILTAALQIHSVEARHAARVRRLRGRQSWITGENQVGLPPEAAPIYKGEANATQGGVDLTMLVSNIDPTHIWEAFDEPLTKEEVAAVASLFLA